MRLLHINGFQSVAHLTTLLGVSDMTVRRDLGRLAEAGELRVVHGGASLRHATLRTADFTSRGAQERSGKRQIAHRAGELISANDTVAIDAGTTAFELATTLPADFRGCVISHSVPVLQHMLNAPEARVIGLGGELLTDSQAFVGQLTTEALAGLRANTVFLGAAAVGERDLFVATDHERPTKRALIACAEQVVLLADHSKFEAAAPVRLGPLSDVDTLVTDRPLPAGMGGATRAAGVTVLTAGPHDD